MDLLKERICRDGIVKDDHVLRVDSFLNHQVDVTLLSEIGKELRRRFDGEGINKILTIEASGIGIACIVAQSFDDCPVVFAKKNKTANIDDSFYSTRIESFTHGRVYDVMLSKEYLNPEDRVLIVDDFLANGCALMGLTEIIEEAGATFVGAGIVIEKGFQPGGDNLRAKGYRVESLAIIDKMDPVNGITFRE